jgi:hypothetical protein
MSSPGRGPIRHGRLLSQSLLTAFLLLLAGLPAFAYAQPAHGSPAGGVVVEERVDESPQAVRGSWARADFLKALPAPTPEPGEDPFGVRAPSAGVDGAAASGVTGDFVPADVTSYPERIHGKVFFKFGGTGYSCSGTVVDSATGRVIFTAGHCVYRGDIQEFASDFVFVPGYENGNAPFGIWAAVGLYTTAGWVDTGMASQDVAVAVLDRPIPPELGSRKVAFGLDPVGREYTLYGYPSKPDPPYDGQRLIGCDSMFAGRDSNQGTPRPIVASPCEMRQGSSGGGWITGGYLNSVVSYGYCDSDPGLCGYVFGPYFGDQAMSLYVYAPVGGSVRPRVRIASGPPRRSPRPRVAFRFTGTGSTPIDAFRCSLNGRRFSACRSSYIRVQLRPGKYVLRVRAVDQTGKLSANTARYPFRVIARRR